MKKHATKEKLALLNILRHRPIAYHVEFARIGGGVTAGLFLSQLFFWSDKGSDEDGWIYKTGEQWKKETGLTRREQESARTALKKRGLIEEKRSGLPARLFFRVKIDAIIDKLAENPDEHCDKQECTKRTNKNAQNVQTGMYETYKLETPDEPSNGASLQPVPEPPEITTEITTEISLCESDANDAETGGIAPPDWEKVYGAIGRTSMTLSVMDQAIVEDWLERGITPQNVMALIGELHADGRTPGSLKYLDHVLDARMAAERSVTARRERADADADRNEFLAVFDREAASVVEERKGAKKAGDD